jgi:hypothetical protein
MNELFILLGLGFFPVTIILTVLWFHARERARRAEEMIDQLMLTQTAHRGVSNRDDLATAVDAIAQAVDRMAESQRLMTHLLAERHERVPALPARVITPH